MGSTGGFGSIAKELGISESQVASGAQALLPAILGGFKRQANAQPSGMDALGGLLGWLTNTLASAVVGVVVGAVVVAVMHFIPRRKAAH